MPGFCWLAAYHHCFFLVLWAASLARNLSFKLSFLPRKWEWTVFDRCTLCISVPYFSPNWRENANRGHSPLAFWKNDKADLFNHPLVSILVNVCLFVFKGLQCWRLHSSASVICSTVSLSCSLTSNLNYPFYSLNALLLFQSTRDTKNCSLFLHSNLCLFDSCLSLPHIIFLPAKGVDFETLVSFS